MERATQEQLETYLRNYLLHFQPFTKASAIQKWNYTAGCVLTGAGMLYEVTRDPSYLKAQELFLSEYLDEEGHIKGYDPAEQNVDLMASGRAFYPMLDASGSDRFLRGIDRIYRDLMQQPRCRCGNFWHKRIYPNQVWLDGVYMVQPFLTEYITRFHAEKDYSDVLNQFRNVRKLLFDVEMGLYRHGYEETKTIFWADPADGRSKSFWLRSMGWYAMALVDCYERMEDAAGRRLLMDLYGEMMAGLLPYRDLATGLFYQVVHLPKLPGNYTETSGSNMIAYALMKGERLGMGKDGAIGASVFEAVVREKLRATEDGTHLFDNCSSAGLGPFDNPRRDGTAEYYVSEPVVSDNAHGVSTLMMAYAEYLKRK